VEQQYIGKATSKLGLAIAAAKKQDAASKKKTKKK